MKKLYILLTAILVTAMIFANLTIFVLAAHTASPTPLKFTDHKNQLTFTLTPPNTNPHNYTLSFPTITQENGVAIAFTFSGNVMDVTSAQTITINVSNVNYGKLNPGKNYNGNIVVTDANNNTDTLTVPVSFVGSFCKQGEKGTDLEINKVDIDNSDGDDDEWSPLDEIEIKVEVSNEGDEKIKDVNVEIGLFNSEGKNVIKDMKDLDNEEIELGSIKDDDEDTATFNFKVP
ncbi:MAG: putative S-layer protein, partial [Nanoarchaeota archaeon]